MAFGSSTLSDASGAVSDLFAAEGHRAKGQGDLMEAQNYDLAAEYAQKNVEYTDLSTKIKNMQTERQIYQGEGQLQAGVAASGFTSGGSAGDLMRESASQGALTHAVLSQQGLIQEQGYQEQAASYQNMSKAARMAAEAEDKAATGADITGVIKGIAGIASIGLAPFTGGASLAIGGLFMGGGSPSGYGKG